MTSQPVFIGTKEDVLAALESAPPGAVLIVHTSSEAKGAIEMVAQKKGFEARPVLTGHAIEVYLRLLLEHWPT